MHKFLFNCWVNQNNHKKILQTACTLHNYLVRSTVSSDYFTDAKKWAGIRPVTYIVLTISSSILKIEQAYLPYGNRGSPTCIIISNTLTTLSSFGNTYTFFWYSKFSNRTITSNKYRLCWVTFVQSPYTKGFSMKIPTFSTYIRLQPNACSYIYMQAML